MLSAMNERSYNQYCPIAHALDVVGDRWALLIIRDLLLGPKRFSDLQNGLPGIGTNILTNRLKGLEQAGIVQRRTLPPPAASAVYELTAYGRELEAPLMKLAHWGAQSLGASHSSQVISRDSVLLTVRALCQSLMPGDAVTYQVDVVDPRIRERVMVQVIADVATIMAESEIIPDMSIQLDVDTLFALARGTFTLAEAVESGAVQLSGKAFERLSV